MIPFSARSISQCWLSVAEFLCKEPDQRAFHVFLEVSNPLEDSPEDGQVMELVDALLQEKGKRPLRTVANTIFPADLYRRSLGGAKGIYDHYPEEVVPLLKRSADWRWGTYAYRLVRRERSDGTLEVHPRTGAPLNPLREVVERIKLLNAQRVPNYAAYEIGLLEPVIDLPITDLKTDRTPRGGPCLSHLSFKIVPGEDGRTLDLCAFYRNHDYFEKALGNFIGLRNLLAFAANEAQLAPGRLVIISSQAYLGGGVHHLAEGCGAIYGGGRSGGRWAPI